ncbi:hypothetical protein B9Z55_019618 [Caenorhabditis nigoni]|nr:hypothetical protein B9Z55_019618 [Caenorhabditis nigoni]
MLKYDTATEPAEVSDDIQCAKNGESSLFVFDPVSSPKEMIARNFFSNACYNVSMHSEHFHVFCRCNQTNCNSPESDLPYPISPPTVTCHTSGFDDDVNRKKYLNESEEFQEYYQRLMINDSYFDEGVECRGHFCFIAIDEVYIKNKLKKVHYKGCISANEHGDNKIQLGYSLLNDYPYYICNSDYCNYNIRSVLDDSKKNSSIEINFQTCITGVKMPPYTCSMQDDDELACYCKTDYCNDDKIFWSNYTALPIIECKQTDCNSPEVPIPYPLPPPTVSCYTSGFDGQVNPKKYEKPDTHFNDNYNILMGNDSYVDDNSTCRGNLCFVASVLAQIGENELDIYYKGCISTNEQGDYSIQSCIAGATKPSYNCTLDYDDNLVCYCSTDFCNVSNLFHTNVSIIPITTCKSIVQNVYQEKACNKCIRTISYIKRDRYDMDKYPNQNTDLKDLNEEVRCNTDADSGDFLVGASIYMPERLLRNFFAKACYNVSLHREHYYIHCRCVELKVNTRGNTVNYSAEL